jgi:hypothetical protein
MGERNQRTWVNKQIHIRTEFTEVTQLLLHMDSWVDYTCDAY